MVDRCQFRRPRVTPNPGFKVAVYLKVEYLKNGYCRTLIIHGISNGTTFNDVD